MFFMGLGVAGTEIDKRLQLVTAPTLLLASEKVIR